MQGSHWLPEMTGTLNGNKNGNNAVGIGFCRVPNGTPKIGWVVLLPATLWQATLIECLRHLA
ncbi:MAG: hypothetical protein IKS94_07830 [Prevotella sp.]|nr:hypothetical protein [Prevotella sp.]